MTHLRTLSAALLLLLVAVICAAPPAAAQQPGDEVGRMALVREDVRGTAPGEAAEAMAVGDPVVLEHLIETGRASAARMSVGPEGVLTLGQDARLTVDRAAVDRATGRTESAFGLLLGKIELALGSLFRGEVAIETPTATLAVKGTVVRVLVLPSGRTVVSVLEGTVEVTSKAGGTVDVTAGRYTVVAEGEPPLPPAPFDPSAGTLSPSADGPDFAVPGEELFDESPLLRGEQIDLPREPPVPEPDPGNDQNPNDPQG